MKTFTLPPVRGFDNKLFHEVNKRRQRDGISWRGLLTLLFKHYLEIK